MVRADDPSVVLIHGAWHGAWCWDLVADELSASGWRVVAPELPFSGHAADVAAARRAIEEAGPGCVVLGHSYGGLAVSEAARAMGGVRHLIYLAALMLDDGEDPAALLADHGADLLASLVFEGSRLAIDPAKARELLYGDSGDEAAAAATSRLRSMAGRP